MKWVIVVGSHQTNSQSLKVGNFFASLLRSKGEVSVLDLRELGLPIWTPEFYKNEDWVKKWSLVEKDLSEADGYIFVTPEYNGMATPILKNFILYLNAKTAGHRPTLIVSVSGGIAGNYPISDLRASGYKNPRICYVPEQVVVRYAKSVLNEKEPVNDSDLITRKRIEYGIKILVAYSEALAEVRKKENLLSDEFEHGM